MKDLRAACLGRGEEAPALAARVAVRPGDSTRDAASGSPDGSPVAKIPRAPPAVVAARAPA
eukprot:11436903-Alexandrium_andersonii.AAC.1